MQERWYIGSTYQCLHSSVSHKRVQKWLLCFVDFENQHEENSVYCYTPTEYTKRTLKCQVIYSSHPRIPFLTESKYISSDCLLIHELLCTWMRVEMQITKNNLKNPEFLHEEKLIVNKVNKTTDTVQIFPLAFLTLLYSHPGSPGWVGQL